MDACATGDNTKLFDYLEENGLQDVFDEVLEEYNAEACQQVLASCSGSDSKSISSAYANGRAPGTIFMWYGSDPVAEILINGHWKHTAMRGDNTTTRQLINAGKNGMSGSGNGVSFYSYAANFSTHTTSVWWISGASASKGLGAYNYAKSQLGEPYGFMSAHDDTTAWYCSKLAWRAWLSQGYDIEENGWDFWNYHILAQAIADDANTYRIGGDAW